MSSSANTEYQGRTAYPDFVAEVSDGHYARDVSKELTELVDDLRTQAAAQSKKVKGKLTIELSFECDERGEVDFNYATKTKRPSRPTVRGGLTSVHPRQLTIGDAIENARRPARPTEERAPKAKAPERTAAPAVDDTNDEET